MSINDDREAAPPVAAADAAAVLGRLSEVAGARNDAALARALGVSRQSLSSWRKRGPVPFEVTVKFAAERGLSLDFLLLGRGTAWTAGGAVVPQLLMEIVEELESQIRELGSSHASQVGEVRRLFAYHCGILYNRIVGMAAPGIDPYKLVRGEVKYFLVLSAVHGTDKTEVVEKQASGKKKTTALSGGKHHRT